MLIYETGFSYMKMGRAGGISVVPLAIVMVPHTRPDAALHRAARRKLVSRRPW